MVPNIKPCPRERKAEHKTWDKSHRLNRETLLGQEKAQAWVTTVQRALKFLLPA